MKPSISELTELLRYDPQTGELHWKISPTKKVKVGAKAGCITSRGYVQIRYLGFSYMAHRVIWYMFKGKLPNLLDHINGDRKDNRIENLREASTFQNQMN